MNKALDAQGNYLELKKEALFKVFLLAEMGGKT